MLQHYTTAIKTILAITLPMIIANIIPGHQEEHGIEFELPKERLNPGLHDPHSIPERL